MVELEPLSGLRGIGAICIVTYHFFTCMTPNTAGLESFPVYAPEFMSVVTLFFVISGFTLACVYNKNTEKMNNDIEEQVQQQSIPLQTFLLKRISHLAPVYYFSLLVGLWPFLAFNPADQRAICIPFTLLWLQSLIPLPVFNWNVPLWQASALALIYPFFPIVLQYLRKWSTLGLIKLIISLWVVSFILFVSTLYIFQHVGINVGCLHRFVPLRYPQFFMGMCFGLVGQRGELEHPTAKAEICTLFLALSSMLVCPLVVHYVPTIAGVFSWDFYCVVSEFVITPIYALWVACLATAGCGGITRKVLVWRPVLLLGEISYSLYCTHAPLLYWAAWAVANNGVSSESLPYRSAPNGLLGLFIVPAWAFIPFF